MPITSKVLQLTQSELAADLDRLHREHLEELRAIARNPKRHGPHLRSGTHGRAIFDEICKTYRARAEAIHEALLRSLRFQDGQAFTVDELAAAFNELFGPERSKVLEYSRTRLAEIRDGSFINDTVTEANSLLTWFRAKAEHIVADQQSQSGAEEPPKVITGSGVLIAGSAKVSAYGRGDTRDDLDRVAESRRELERLQKVLPTIPDHELSAYSTKSLPIGTFLNHYGHAFSVLTEDMFAEAFKEELKRRETKNRESWRSLLSPRFLVGTLILGIIGVVAKCSWAPTQQTSEEPLTTVSPPSPQSATAAAPPGEATGNQTQPVANNAPPAPGVTIGVTVGAPGPREVTSDPPTATAAGQAPASGAPN